MAIPAQAQLSRLSFGQYKISSISPRSLRSVDGAVQVQVRNDTTSFTMSNIRGIVYRNGTPFVQGYASDVNVNSGNNLITVPGNVSLCPGISLWSVLGCIVGFDIDEFTVDVAMTVTMADGSSRQLVKRGLKVGEVVRNRLRR